MDDSFGSRFRALDADIPKVWHHEEHKILYLHLPKDEDFPRSETMGILDTLINRALYYRDRQIDKLVIDLRSNDQMSYFPLKKLVATVLKSPVYLKNEYYILDSDSVIRKIEEKWPRNTEVEKTKTIGEQRYVLHINKTDTIVPSSDNLGYDGPIYIFVDEFCSPAVLFFVELLKQDPRFTIVGVPSGKIAKEYFMSIFFALPNSGISFSFSPFVFLPDDLSDLYKNGIEVILQPDYDYYYKRKTQSGYIYSYEYMKENDTFFQWLLKEE